MNGSTAKAWVVIPAAGVGKRMKADRPKQYLPLLGKTVIQHTLACFFQRDDIQGVVLVLHPNDPYWPDLKVDAPIPLHVVAGGKERSDSVLNGLDFLLTEKSIAKDTWILVHDAARPCLLQRDIDHLMMSQSDDHCGGILATPVRDTMKRQDAEGCIAKSEDREGMWHALTPQMFRLGVLQNALFRALARQVTITDEASALEYVGERPRLIEGSASNIKITHQADLALAEFILEKDQ